MNLRIAILEKKAISVDGLIDDKIENPDISNWVVMGHFDMLSVQKFEVKDNFFNTIYDNNRQLLSSSDSNSYYYPIYLISNKDDSEFWDTTATFSAIIKIHFFSSINYQESYSLLEQQLLNNDVFKALQYQIYDTFELSDAVVVFKSNYLSAILKCIATLRSFQFIGKIYTYPAISTEALKNENDFFETDNIDYLSLRFSLNSSSQVSHFINELKKILNIDKVYSITGVDDLLFIYRNASARDLYNFYNRIFLSQSHDASFLSTSITRVGVTIGDDYFDSDSICSDETNETLYETCKLILRVLDKIKIAIEPQKYKWFDSLFELIKLLSRMSKSPILDEFVYLLLPGMIPFINNLSSICSNQKEIDEFAYEYNDFVQGLTDLIEQIMRSEVQLAHNPELRPIMYNLPIVMLEYMQAFLKQCSEFLKKFDVTNESIRLLLVPKIIDRLETVEIFSATSENDGLIQISIPLDMLYNPSQLQCNLCHEISHFIGEHHRHRESRLVYYSKAVSILISKTLFNDFSHSRINAIEKQLSKKLRSVKNSDGKYRMRQMQSIVERWIEEWCWDEKNYYEFTRELLEELPKTERIDITGNIDTIYYNYSKYFSHLLEQLGRLFKEIYADICMLFLLPISPEEYLKQFSKELSDENPEYPLDDMGDVFFGSQLYEIYSIRMYVSLKATNNKLPKYTNEDLGYYKKICENLHRIDMNINSEDEIDSYIPMGVVIKLLEYAEECYKSLKTSVCDDNELEYINNNILRDNSDFNYAKISKFISEYRKDLLNEFEKELSN